MGECGLAVVVARPGVVTLREEPPQGTIREGQFDVETVFSGLSTGTDLSWIKGTNPGSAVSEVVLITVAGGMAARPAASFRHLPRQKLRQV